jgi:hypothetical protein
VRRETLVLLWNGSITALLWAVALTYTAGRLTRIGFEWARPYAAKALHALAIALDGGLLYPDQPEPDPTPDLVSKIEILRPCPEPEHGTFMLGTRAADKPAAAKPRARRRTTRAAA